MQSSKDFGRKHGTTGFEVCPATVSVNFGSVFLIWAISWTNSILHYVMAMFSCSEQFRQLPLKGKEGVSFH